MGLFSKVFGIDKEREYREYLEGELEQLKESGRKDLEKEKNAVADLQDKLQKAEEAKKKLQAEVESLLEKQQEARKNAARQQEDYESRLSEYRQNYNRVAEVLIMAQQDADKKKDEARSEAELVREQAQAEAARIKQEAQEEIRKQIEANEKQLNEIKRKLMHHIDSVNAARGKLESAYEQIGSLIEELPLKESDLFPEQGGQSEAAKTTETVGTADTTETKTMDGWSRIKNKKDHTVWTA